MMSDTQTTNLRDIVRIFFKHKFKIIIPIIPAMLITYVIAEFNTPMYSATVKMMVAGLQITEATHYRELSSTGDATMTNLVLFLKARTVKERVVEALKLYEIPPDYEKRFASPLKRAFIEYQFKKNKSLIESRRAKLTQEQEKAVLVNDATIRLSNNVIASTELGKTTFSITVMDFNPNMAAKIANSVSRSYVIYDLERQIVDLKYRYGERHDKVTQLRKYIAEFQKTLDGETLPDLDAMGPSGIKIIEQAVVKYSDSGIDKIRMQVVIFLISIGAGIILSLIIEFFDPTFKSPNDIETFLNIPCLGFIPGRKYRNKLHSGGNNPHTGFVSLYEGLTEQIFLLMKDKKLKCILMMGAESSEDIAETVAGIGSCAAQKGDKKVLIIDTNMRDPVIFKTLNISNNPGLADVLKGDVLFEDAVQNPEPNLYVLTSDKTAYNPTTLLSLYSMRDLIEKAKEVYEIVFLSCASVKDFTDAANLSSLVDGSILVINEGKTKYPILKIAIAPLEQKKDHLLGAILNNRAFVIPKWIYDRI